MENKKVSVLDMMRARDLRVEKQSKLISKYNKPLISFTMNIAGEIKNSKLILRGFEHGIKTLKLKLEISKIDILHEEITNDFTGNEAFFVVDEDANIIKKICVELEDYDELSRLYDIDVIDTHFYKLERKHLRKCLMCDRAAKECAGRRTHSVSELVDKTNQILNESFQKIDANYLASQAVRALLFEALATPKVGLVDRNSSKSHSDMDIFTFVSSSVSLYNYFFEAASFSLKFKDMEYNEFFRELQKLGKRAELTMFAATKGVNTHKGAIFSLGLLCGACGRLGYEKWSDFKLILKECSKIAKGIVKNELEDKLKNSSDEVKKGTFGEKIYKKYGISGVRGQAEGGYLSVLNYGMPKFESCIKRGMSLNDAGCIALLDIISATMDTNMIKRSDYESFLNEKKRLKKMLELEPYPSMATIKELDIEYTNRGLSPGGSADLLAMCYMLYFISED